MPIPVVGIYIGYIVARVLFRSAIEFFVRERGAINACLRKFQPPRGGPKLNLATALADIADANRSLADAETLPELPRAGWRYRCDLVYNSHAGQRAFFRALRVGPKLASVVGSVSVDVEEVPASSRGAAAAARGAAAEEEEEDDAAPAAAARGGDDGEIEVADEAAAAADDDDDGFEHVGACRRMTLAQFYTMLRPALAQIAVDALASSSFATTTRPPRRVRIAGGENDDDDDDDDDDARLCSICMDGEVEIVTKCAHAFCEACHLRWLSMSRECPLCRETLGREVSGTNDGSYSLVEWTYAGDDDDGDGDGGGGGGGDDAEAEAEAAAAATSTAERVDAAWLRRRMRELPAVSEPGRRPHERWLARRAAEKAKRRATDHED